MTHLVEKADEEIKKVIDLSLQKQININEAFDVRKQQLKTHLEEYDPIRMPMSSSDYLREFLQKEKTEDHS
jgi:DNA repair protein RadC